MTRLAVPSKAEQVQIVGEFDSFDTSRVQRFNINKNVPTQDVDELGNPLHVGQSRQIPNVTLGISILDVGIKAYSVLTGTDPTAYPGAGVDIAELGEVDVVVKTKSDTVEDYSLMGYGRRLQIQSATFNYAVDQDSTEEYNMIGSTLRWFRNDVVVDRFTTGTTSFALNDTPVQLNNGEYLLSVILDGQYLTEVSSSPATGEYTISGTTLTTADTRTAQVLVVYQANPAGTNWSDISDLDSEISIQGQDIGIEISANSIPRVQSTTINVNMTVQDVRELGSLTVVGYQRQNPTVTGTLNALMTDLDLLDVMTTGQLDSGVTEIETGINCVVSGVPLEIKLFDPCDTDISRTVLKTVYIPDIEVTGEALTINVNNNAQWAIPFRSVTGQCIIYSGARS